MGESAACQQLRAELVAFGFVNLGICGDVRHCGGGQSPCSGGGSSDHCHGNAFDAGNNGIDRDTRYAVIDHILHDGRCTYCIHEGKGQRSYHRGGTYFDSSGHGDHFHTSVHSDSRRNDGSPWGIANVTAGGGGGIVEVRSRILELNEMGIEISWGGQRHTFAIHESGDVIHRWHDKGPGARWQGQKMSDYGQDGEAKSGLIVWEDGKQLHVSAAREDDRTHHWWVDPGARFNYELL